MQPLLETAFAKVNLALHVRRRRSDGYHDLETLFAFVDSGDGLSACLAANISLEVSGPYSAGLSDCPDNLVLSVAKLMQSHFGVTHGAALKLEKRLPVASGIGGGSADAAAAARLLNRLWGLEASGSQLEQLLAPLGADIPACVESITVRGDRKGTALSAISNDDVAHLPILLVNPSVAVATGAVFAGWDGIDRGALADGLALEVALAGRNDLERPAISICPSIVDVLAVLEATKPTLARMSGSGATCFAIYDTSTARDAVLSEVKSAHPGWWALAGVLR
jgi:4-diphosphocytidyl-2-C-methyl-D-erythritol kinase